MGPDSSQLWQSGPRGKSQNLQLQLSLVGYWGGFGLQEYSPGMSPGRSATWSLGKNRWHSVLHRFVLPSPLPIWAGFS